MTTNWTSTLSVSSHPRDNLGLGYVYAVASRRSGGISVGINVNPNKACNYRCLYCQVEGLTRGKAPALDLKRLKMELKAFLGDASRAQESEEPYSIRDIAISGDGEPTSLEAFDELVLALREALFESGLLGLVKVVLITNGTLLRRARVQKGLALLAAMQGEVWFKLDAASQEGILKVHDTRVPPLKLFENLKVASSLCITWVHTLCFRLDGTALLDMPREREAYLAFLGRAQKEGLPLGGVVLYTLARPSLQPEAPRLSAVSEAWLQALASDVHGLGFDVHVHP
jgi:hypothetical protein